MPDLPPDGTLVDAMTYASIEYDREAEPIRGVLRTRPSPFGPPPQCWIDLTQVDPDTVRPAVVSYETTDE